MYDAAKLFVHPRKQIQYDNESINKCNILNADTLQLPENHEQYRHGNRLNTFKKISGPKMLSLRLVRGSKCNCNKADKSKQQ